MTAAAVEGVGEAWDRFWTLWEQLRVGLSRSTAILVNTGQLRGLAQQLVQLYFREARPELVDLFSSEDRLRPLDESVQELLRLSNTRAPRRAYVALMRRVGRLRNQLGLERELRIGQLGRSPRSQQQATSSLDQRVIATLERMLPTAASSYAQALVDLSESQRQSYRGTAVELREVVREVLDHLAPDDKVLAQTGFKLEKDRTGPTMRQKAMFVFDSRGLRGSLKSAPGDAVSVVDELSASFVRSTYERGSVSTHTAGTKDEMRRLAMYVNVVLAELLEVG